MAANLDHVTAPKFEDGGNRVLLAGDSGVTQADPAAQLTVFLDDLPSTVGANHRTW